MRSFGIGKRTWRFWAAFFAIIVFSLPCFLASAGDMDKSTTDDVVAEPASRPFSIPDQPIKDAQAPHAFAHKNMLPGESILLSGRAITRAAVNLPEVVDLVVVSKGEVILNAKAEGKAVVRIWDSVYKPATYYVTVTQPKPEPEAVAAELAAQVGVPTINIQVNQTGVLLSGTAKSDEQIKRAEYIAQSTGLKVVNLIKLDAISAASVIEALREAINNPAVAYKELPDNTVMITGDVPTTTEALKIRDIIGAWVEDVQPASGAGTSVKSDTQVNFISNDQITIPDAVDKARTEAALLDPGGVVVGEETNAIRSVFSGRVPNGPRIVAVINVDLATARQVLVTAQVLEVDRSKLKELGVKWGSSLNGVFIDQPFFVLENASGLVPETSIGGVGLNDGINTFSRLPFAAQIRALIDSSYARILSEPKLLIADGRAASILVGGELPIPIAQNSSIGVASVTVQYKPFGIQLTVRPKIGDDDRIALTVTPEVSDVDRDPNAGVRTAGIVVPALTVRRATTTVHVQNCQSLAIGGLFSSTSAKVISEIPLLSKIPVLGELFKSKSFLEKQTELIIVVTPQLIEKGTNAPIPVPKDGIDR